MSQSVETPVRGSATAISDLLSVGGARFASVLLSAVWLPLATRLLAPPEYATLAYFAVVSLLLVNVAASWTAPAVARYGRERIDAVGSMKEVSWARFLVVVPVLGVAGIVLVGLKAFGVLPQEFSWMLTLLAFTYAAVVFAVLHTATVLEAVGRMKVSAVCSVAAQVMVVLVVIVFSLAGTGDSALAVGSAMVAASGVVALVLVRSVWRIGLWPPALDRQLTRRLVLFSLPLVAFSVSQSVIGTVDLIIIRAFGTVEQAGIYAVAYQSYGALQQVAAAVIVVLVPLFVSLQLAKKQVLIRQYFERLLPQLIFVFALVIGFLIPFVPFALDVVVPSPYEQAAESLSVLFLSLILFFGASLLAPILVLHERTKAIGYVNALAAAVNVVGDILLIGVFHTGISGAAWATCAASLIVFGGYLIVARQCLDSDAWVNPLLWAPVPAALLPTLFFSGIGAVAASLALAAAVGVLAFFAARPFEQRDLELIDVLGLPPRVGKLVRRGLAKVAR